MIYSADAKQRLVDRISVVTNKRNNKGTVASDVNYLATASKSRPVTPRAPPVLT
jgi:hypothetical protein